MSELKTTLKDLDNLEMYAALDDMGRYTAKQLINDARAAHELRAMLVNSVVRMIEGEVEDHHLICELQHWLECDEPTARQLMEAALLKYPHLPIARTR